MFGFDALPPEVNSGLLYTGPGAAPMAAASAAWDALADDLYTVASAYSSAISELTSTWLGPSSLSMAAAAATYVSWISATAVQAEHTAAQARAAVAAYEAAFAMTVPPAVIAANRALLFALIASNFFGQNTPAIMATEAEYFQMWAQDAAAMYGYAAASSAASTITPFTQPPQTATSSAASGLAAAATQAAATPAGTGVQSASSLSSAAMPSLLQAATSSMATTTSTSTASTTTAGTSLASGATSSASMLTSAVSMLGSSGPLARGIGSTSALTGGFPMFNAPLTVGSGSPVGAVSAVSARAASLGALSVPPGWTSAAPAFSQVASALPAGSGLATGGAAPTPPSSGSTPPLASPVAQTAEQAGTRSPLAARYNYRPPMVQRPVYAG